MEAELEAYEYQLQQVTISLDADPDNQELSTLKTELEEIIELTRQALGKTTSGIGNAVAGSSETKKGKGKEKAGFKAGEEVSARYKDMQWYPARITAVNSQPNDPSNPSYTLIFKGYTSPTTLPGHCLRSLDAATASGASPALPPSSAGKRKLTAQEEEREKEKRRKKNEKWAETQKEKTRETLEKKNAWENFGKKAAKKGIKIGGLQGKSIFASPDNPTGKVGVVGSGSGVTSYEARGKHKFMPGASEGTLG